MRVRLLYLPQPQPRLPYIQPTGAPDLGATIQPTGTPALGVTIPRRISLRGQRCALTTEEVARDSFAPSTTAQNPCVGSSARLFPRLA
jgi:hypothetical protein